MTNLCRMRAGIRRPGGMNCFFTDIIRDPYVFEFLGVAENKPMQESDLEKVLVAQIEKKKTVHDQNP